MAKKLYLVTTKQLGDFYIVAESPNDAQYNLERLLNEADYGFSDHRAVVNIKLLAELLHYYPEGKPFFGFKNCNLIII